MRSTVLRGVWCGALAVCPVALVILGLAFERPPGLHFDRPWPAYAVDGFIYAHLALTAVAAVSAFWVWRQYWWLAWAGILVIGWLTAGVALTAAMSVTGVSL